MEHKEKERRCGPPIRNADTERRYGTPMRTADTERRYKDLVQNRTRDGNRGFVAQAGLVWYAM